MERLDAFGEDSAASLLVNVLGGVTRQRADQAHAMLAIKRRQPIHSGLENHGEVASHDDAAIQRSRRLNQESKVLVQLRSAAGDVDDFDGWAAREQIDHALARREVPSSRCARDRRRRGNDDRPDCRPCRHSPAGVRGSHARQWREAVPLQLGLEVEALDGTGSGSHQHQVFLKSREVQETTRVRATLAASSPGPLRSIMKLLQVSASFKSLPKDRPTLAKSAARKPPLCHTGTRGFDSHWADH